MAHAEPTAYASPPVRDPVQTNADTKTPISRTGWQPFIEKTLLSWLSDPLQLQDAGIDAPSPMIIRLSLDVAESLRDQGRMPAPDSIVPDPNGGIVFERRKGDVSEVIHVWDDGSVEYMRFHGARLIERRPLFESGN